MPNSTDWNRVKGQLSGLGFDKAAADADRYASGPSLEERQADAQLADLRAKLNAVNSAIAAGQEQVRQGGSVLPKGFVPIRQVKFLFQMGRWPKLADGHEAMSPPGLL